MQMRMPTRTLSQRTRTRTLVCSMVVTSLICRKALINGDPHQWHIQMEYNIKVTGQTTEPT
jgi:hypothetical protein